MTYSAVPLDAMRAHLLTPGQAREQLGRTEVTSETVFDCGKPDLDIEYGEGWFDRELTDPAPVWLTVPGEGVFQLTRQAAWELGSTCHITQGYQQMIPAALLQQHVQWWLREGLSGSQLKLLLAGRGEYAGTGSPVPLAVAQTRAAVTPFSNLQFMDVALGRVARRYGQEAADSALVDYKMHHDLEHTVVRVVIPAVQEVVEETGEADDAWCMGVEFTNSAIGLKQTTCTGYLFRFICTNGARDIAHSAGGLSRRGTTPDQAYEWMGEAVDDVLGGLEGAFDRVRGLTQLRVVPDTTTVLRDLFKQFGIPKAQCLRVIETIADTGGVLTFYDLLNAVTRAANLPGLEYRAVAQLLAAGGHMIHNVGARCEGQLRFGCRRMLPRDWEPPPEPDED